MSRVFRCYSYVVAGSVRTRGRNYSEYPNVIADFLSVHAYKFITVTDSGCNQIPVWNMEYIHMAGAEFIHYLQKKFDRYEDLMLVLSHLGDPRNAFLLYFPISYCLHRPTGTAVLWLACLSEWINAVLKWIIFGDRPYWWIRESGLFSQNTTYLKQYSLTCETGPGSPSGHAMVTASVLFCMVSSSMNTSYINSRKYMRYTVWGLYVIFMLAVTLSRCFIATHFPHQVLLGTFIGKLHTIYVSCFYFEMFYSYPFPHQVLLGTFTRDIYRYQIATKVKTIQQAWSNITWLSIIKFIQVGILLFIEFMKVPVDDLQLKYYITLSAVIPGSSLLLYFTMKGLDLDPGWSVDLATKWCQKTEWVHLDTTPFNSVIRDAGSILGFGLVHVIKKTASRPKEESSHFIRILQIILALIYSQVLEQLKPGKTDASFYYCLTFVKFCVQAVGVYFISLLYLFDVVENSNKNKCC